MSYVNYCTCARELRSFDTTWTEKDGAGCPWQYLGWPSEFQAKNPYIKGHKSSFFFEMIYRSWLQIRSEILSMLRQIYEQYLVRCLGVVQWGPMGEEQVSCFHQGTPLDNPSRGPQVADCSWNGHSLWGRERKPYQKSEAPWPWIERTWDQRTPRAAREPGRPVALWFRKKTCQETVLAIVQS